MKTFEISTISGNEGSPPSESGIQGLTYNTHGKSQSADSGVAPVEKYCILVGLNQNGEKEVIGIDNCAYATEAGCEKVEPPPSYDETIQVEQDKQAEEIDPWELVAPPDTGKPWNECSTSEKAGRVTITIIKILSIVLMLYLFICSIDVLGAAFQLLGGRTAGAAFQSDLLQNPICGLAIGIAITALLQSSSTSTSIVVTMVAANILTVEQGIYIIMGANVGTAITSGIVALSQVAEKNQFRRAFASSMLLYMFNLLTVIVLLPLEYCTGYLYKVTKLLVDTIEVDTSNPDTPQFLKVITLPFTQWIVQVDKDVIAAIAEERFSQKRPLTKYICNTNSSEDIVTYTDYPYGTNVTEETYYQEVRDNKTHPTLWSDHEKIENVTIRNTTANTTVTRFSWSVPDFDSETTEPCHHLFVGAGLPSEYVAVEGWPDLGLPDEVVGIILTVISLFGLCACLIGIVKVLSSLLKGSVLKTVRKSVNADFPCGKFGKELAGYVAVLMGAGMTILVQSSSVFTAALNPLAGMGIVTLERVYPLTVGADIGTTITSILAAFTSDPASIRNALQCAFAHFFFNVTGFLLYYPLPFMRKIPIYFAVGLGNITADYKWFAIVFLCMTYFILPLLVFLLSIPGWEVLVGVSVPIIIICIVIAIINRMQTKCPTALPNKCQSWDWCPLWCHSLEPYDKCFTKCCPCKICKENVDPESNATDPIVMEVINGDLKNISDENKNSNNSNSLFEETNETSLNKT